MGEKKEMAGLPDAGRPAGDECPEERRRSFRHTESGRIRGKMGL